MDKGRLPNSIFILLVVFGAGQFVYYVPRIPEVLGAHFARGGFVNGWQTNTAFFSAELAMIVLATVVSFGIPRIISAVPVLQTNLPHKEYWLAPERRENTLAYIQVWSAWFGCGLLVFLLFVMELVFRANLRTPAQLDNAAFIPALLAFVAFDTMLVLRLILHFSRTPDR